MNDTKKNHAVTFDWLSNGKLFQNSKLHILVCKKSTQPEGDNIFCGYGTILPVSQLVMSFCWWLSASILFAIVISNSRGLRAIFRFDKQMTPHYIDIIMTTMASQITSLTVVYLTVYSNADQRRHQISESLAFVLGIHRDRWIPRSKGQLRGKCFHLMTSSCPVTGKPLYGITYCNGVALFSLLPAVLCWKVGYIISWRSKTENLLYIFGILCEISSHFDMVPLGSESWPIF